MVMEQIHCSATANSAEQNNSILLASAALSAALALHRTPELRFGLRASPLPGDVDLIMRLAAANQPLLDDTANEVDLSADTLLEAARFYLQQILLDPGLDAYRILGATPETSHEQLRKHHYWLQRWLHPDHNSGSPEAVFAGRLNWAWQQLRTDEARQRYDAERALSVTTEHGPETAAPALAPVNWTTIPLSASERPGYWWKRGALGAVFSGFLVLLYLAVVRSDYALTSGTGPSVTPVAGIHTADSAESLPNPALTTAPRAVVSSPPAPLIPEKAPPAAARYEHKANAPRATSREELNAQQNGETSSPIAPPSAPPANVANHRRAADGRTFPVLASTPPALQSARASLAEAPNAAPSSLPARTRPAWRAPRPIPTAPPTVSIQMAPILAAVEPTTKRVARSADDASPRGLVRTHQASKPGSAASDESNLGMMAADRSDPADTPTRSTVSDAALVERVSLARVRVQELLTYFRQEAADNRVAFDAEPPFNAFMQRAALRQRNGVSAIPNFAIDTPMWRLDSEEVALDAVYRVDHARQHVERGHFGVRMTWQDEQWLVTQVIVEPKG